MEFESFKSVTDANFEPSELRFLMPVLIQDYLSPAEAAELLATFSLADKMSLSHKGQ